MTTSVEYGPAFNAAGEFQGIKSRPELMRCNGLYCQSAHIVMFRWRPRGDPEIAVAIRARNRPMWPFGLDFTAGGMTDATRGADGSWTYDTRYDTMIREAGEELGIDVTNFKVVELSSWVPADGYNSVSTVYGIVWPEGVPVPHDDKEIDSIKWMSITTAVDSIRNGAVVKPDFARWLLAIDSELIHCACF
jgi:8-oxo-dGTP pyrophosphatase MutT (NUDIX family)